MGGWWSQLMSRDPQLRPEYPPRFQEVVVNYPYERRGDNALHADTQDAPPASEKCVLDTLPQFQWTVCSFAGGKL